MDILITIMTHWYYDTAKNSTCIILVIRIMHYPLPLWPNNYGEIKAASRRPRTAMSTC